MTTMQSTHAMSEAMKGATQNMRRMNRQLKLPQLAKVRALVWPVDGVPCLLWLFHHRRARADHEGLCHGI